MAEGGKSLKDLKTQARVLKSQITKATNKVENAEDPTQVDIEYAINTLTSLKVKFDEVFQMLAFLSMSVDDDEEPSEESETLLNNLTEEHTNYLFSLNNSIERLKTKLFTCYPAQHM